ncbi:MAG: hypothetical protein KAR07_07875 [Spirochaetes bacterium]|nr:hypothetical protein [Spirochaetota bacterium]
MRIRNSNLVFVMVIIASISFLSCGNEWDAVSKKGNTWEYQVEKSGQKITVVSQVKETYKIGDAKYAEVTFDTNTSKEPSTVFSWNKKQEAIMIAGRSSLFGDNKTQFFVEESIFGKIKGGKGTKFKNNDGSTVTYLSNEKLKIGKEGYDAYKFSRFNPTKNINETYWYVSKKGFVQIKRKESISKLLKFTKGKGGDPKKLGEKDFAEEGFSIAKAFYMSSLKAGTKGIMQFFSKNGKKTADAGMADIKMLVSRIKKHNKPKQASVYFETVNSVGLRFKYYSEEGGEPNVYRVDLILELEKDDGKYKIKDFRITYSKLVS